MDTLVWILVGILLMNFLALGWLVTRDLVGRLQLDKEIRQVDAQWRHVTTPLSATVAWGARGRMGGRHRARGVRRLLMPPRPIGKASIGLAVAATALSVVVAAQGPAAQRTTTSARGVMNAPPLAEPDMRRHAGDSSASGAETSGAGASTQGRPGGAPSNTSIATSDEETVPAKVAAQPRSSTTIYLHWGEVADATGYEVERKQEETQHGWLTIARVRESVTAYADVGLDAATTYFYRVSAVTDAGAAPPSDVVSATTPIAVPDVSTVTAAATLDTIALTWTDVAGETGYRIERSPDGTTGWSTIATTGQDVVIYMDATLSPKTTYYYRVFATNAGGHSAPSNVASATTEPAPPGIDIAPGANDGPNPGGALGDGPNPGGALGDGDPPATEGNQGFAPTP